MSSDLPALATPSMLDDKYRVDSLLAVGGMGSVYRGTHTRLKKTVAIKVLKRELLNSPDLVERFQREAIAASQIGHEGIIEVTDIGTSKAGDAFLVMEFLDGCDLAVCLRNQGALRPATAARLGIEILSALQAAHNKGIIHRDLKPENVFVARRSRGECLKIVDFGISHMPVDGDSSLRLTSTGVVMGTPYYMSPEQALGDSRIGRGADIYSVGVILYELITGAVPFRATNYNALIHQILAGDYATLSQLADVPAALEAAIARAMARKPEERYPDARSFADALRVFAEPQASSLLSADTPPPDTLDEPGSLRSGTAASPVSGTSASALAADFATSATEFNAAGSGTADGNDTLKPVVTPVPPTYERGPRLASPVALGAVLILAAAGIATAILSRGGTHDAKERPAGAARPLVALESDAGVSPSALEPEELFALNLAVAPSDAEIYIDGTRIEGTRIARASGTYQLEVRSPGFESQARTIALTADETIAIALQLTPSQAAATKIAAPATPERSTSRGKRRAKPAAASENKAMVSEPAPGNRRFVEDSPYDAP